MVSNERVTFLDERAILIDNGILKATLVPNWGSNVISIEDKASNRQILYTPRTREEYFSQPIVFGIPVLFLPNRIEDGKFTFGQRQYAFDINEPEKHNHIHGFVHDKPWRVLSHANHSVVTRFESREFPEVERQFSHRFILDLTTVLQGTEIRQIMTVKNESDTTMPLGLGYHTSFSVQAAGDIKVQLPVRKRWILNERSLPTGDFTDQTENIDVTKPLDDVFLVDASQTNKLTLIDEANMTKIEYTCERDFTQWVIFNRDAKSGFLCTEPYTWVTNAPNLNLPNALTGLQLLEPRASKTFETRIRISHLEL